MNATRFRHRAASFCLLLLATFLTARIADAAPTHRDRPDFDEESFGEILPPEGSVSRLLVGSALLEAGDIEAALSYYSFLYRADPTNRLLAERFIEVALRAGRADDALDALDGILSRDEAPELLAQKVELLLMLRRTEAAGRTVSRLLELRPDDPQAQELQMSVWIESEMWEEAQHGLESRVERSPDDPELYRRLGEVHLRRGDNQSAEREFRASFDLDPKDVRTVERLSDLLGVERSSELVPILERFVEAVPRSTVQAARLADLYLIGGEADKAIGVLIPLVRSGTLEVRAEVVLAQLLQSMDRGDEAIKILERRATQAEPSAERQRLLGELSADGGNRQAAGAFFARSLELDSTNGETYASYLLLLSGRPVEDETPEESQERRERLEAVAEASLPYVQENSLRQNFLVGAVFSRLGQYDTALTLLARAAEMAPDDHRALYELALTQEQLERDREAVETLERLLKIDPEDPEILNFYGYILAENGWDLDRAERAINKALAAQPSNGAYLDSLGWVYYKQGHYEEALARIVDATNALGDDPVILEHLGDCLLKLERYGDARGAYERAREVGGDPERLDQRLEEVERAEAVAD